MPNFNLQINYRRPWGPAQFSGIEALRHAANFLDAVASGHRESDAVKLGWNDTVSVNSYNAYGGQAAGLLVESGGAGAVGGTIGGTLVTVTWATSDTVAMTLLAAAIRANATVGMFVTATNKLAQLTCATVVAGQTVRIWNQVFTAIANGVTPTAIGQFSVGASDTACALALVNAINQHPSLAGRIRAVSIAGAVFIGMVDDRVPRPVEQIDQPSAATITVNVAVPVAGPRCMVLANQNGILGNFVTVVASGTGMTYSTNGTAGQLGSGGGGTVPTFTVDLQP